MSHVSRGSVLVAVILAATLLAPRALALDTTTSARCSSLTDVLNTYRAKDLRLRSLLCSVGAKRAWQMASAGTMWHDLRPVMRALSEAGVCWTNVGEALAWNNWSGTARAFIRQWRESPDHWSMLTATRYDVGGGSWSNWLGRHWAAYYVLDLC